MDQEKQPRAYGNHRAPAHYESGDGCLTTLIRIPVRIVVLVIVLPVRMVWDALVATSRAADRMLLRPAGRALAWLCRVLVVIPLVRLYESVLTPLGHGLRRLAAVVGRGVLWLGAAVFVWPWVALWRYVVVPVVRYGIVAPAVRIYVSLLTPLGHGLRRVYRSLLTPVGRGVAAVTVWVLTALFVWPVVGAWRYVLVPLALALDRLVKYLVVAPSAWAYRALLTPLGHGIAWLADVVASGVVAAGRGLGTAVVRLVMTVLVTPVRWFWRQVLAPVGREVAAAIGVAWRIAGYLSRAVGRALAWLAWHLIGAPVAWTYRTVCTPVGHFVRNMVWAPARRAAAEAGRAARGALRTARETVRQARRDAWRALVGGGPAPEPREPVAPLARTLGSTTTVPSAAPEPEISLRKQG
ncbi:hypothetical protein OG894_27935 [Streptomyces sp. NBC_01724]|uniref:hypothetical protein n=1 Tax=unclassified Streptomyces TaxID=2593676 RepID=UPI002E30FCB9|nr:hypothetical protein [Streptomyces sp. NBC_01724]WTE59887.1 hypothetical protein OG784_14415 [Streptomyces sp. NBC_01617]